MEINFYVRSKTETGKIRVWVSKNNNKYFATTDIVIPASWWDNKKGCLKTAFVPNKNRREIEAKLSDLRDLIIDSGVSSSEQLKS